LIRLDTILPDNQTTTLHSVSLAEFKYHLHTQNKTHTQKPH